VQSHGDAAADLKELDRGATMRNADSRASWHMLRSGQRRV